MAKKSKSSTRGASHTAIGHDALETKNFIRPVPVLLDRRFYRPDESTRPPTHQQPLTARITLQVIKYRQRRRQFHAKLNRFNPEYRTKSYLRQRLGFSISRRLEVCLRRKLRKEVLHAKRKTGKAGQRKPRRNFWSAISC